MVLSQALNISFWEISDLPVTSGCPGSYRSKNVGFHLGTVAVLGLRTPSQKEEVAVEGGEGR